ncbi:MAG: DUF4833 domain-containing protein [Elusimicrobia bacterium]|nr:DUF4833 domain-containing protein [Elusimicrobiota bacterium]
MKIVIAALVLIVLVPVWTVAANLHSNTKPLFFIERNKNKNIVQYDVQLIENNDIRELSPVIVYWILENGKQEELSMIEKKYAYGIDSQKKLGKNQFGILLVALKDRKIIVKKIKGSYKAVLSIGGKYSILKKVYINSEERSIGMPKVLYIDLFGWDIKKNLPITERISI